jgi:histidinol dehydrogenase
MSRLRERAAGGGNAEAVEAIVADVRARGDLAVLEYTKRFDGADLSADAIRVGKDEIAAAARAVDPELIGVMRRAAARVADFHRKQLRPGYLEPFAPGEMMGQLAKPLESVGVYVPGGKASYPSSVVMNIVPAKVAGVGRVVMTTPCGRDGTVPPHTIAAGVIAGADEIYKVGGAQAVAALAFGTDTIPRVDKIVGPGNIYVALAKRSVYGYVDVDSIAGPSEILVIADGTASPAFVAADLLSQAEHDEMASSVLVTTSAELAEAVSLEISRQIGRLSRRGIIEKSLEEFGAAIIVADLDEAARLSDEIAPEHLELCVADPFGLLTRIRNAGAVFLGNYSPEPLGDYMAGPNHVLPTGGTARFFSPLGVDHFMKRTSVISFSKPALAALADDITRFAEAEGLTAHAAAVRIRG